MTDGSALCCRRQARLLSRVGDRRVYFVHSFRATPSPENADWVLATSHYGGDFISAVQKGEVNATQFHPEKSGAAGLDIIQSFLEPPREYIAPSANGEAWPSMHSRLVYGRHSVGMTNRAHDSLLRNGRPQTFSFACCFTVGASAGLLKRVAGSEISILNDDVVGLCRMSCAMMWAGCGAGDARGLAKRVIACLDVRANDAGDLVVTKGDQYDVRETDSEGREVNSPPPPSPQMHSTDTLSCRGSDKGEVRQT